MRDSSRNRARQDREVIAGIDLGTVFSSLGTLSPEGEIRLLANCDGNTLTPSALYFEDANKCYVGEEALEMAHIEPWNVVQFVKSHMGEPDFELVLHGQEWSPQELSSLIIRKLIEDAEEELCQSINSAVITVPANFNSAQRLATQEAAELAGVNVLEIISEPCAAALSVEQPLGTTHMIFDLGGGTFDVAITTRKTEKEIVVTSSSGDQTLGGKVWDDLIVNEVANKFVQLTGEDPRDLPESFQELHRSCVLAKEALTSRTSATISVSHSGLRENIAITRQRFEELSQHLLQRALVCCEEALKGAGLQWSSPDKIILVGGSSKMPMISRFIEDCAGFEPILHDNPDSAVTMGAAIIASQIDANGTMPLGESGLNDNKNSLKPSVKDATGHSLGILAMDQNYQQHFLEMIAPHTQIPAEAKGRFAYAYDGMTSVQVLVVERRSIERDSEGDIIGTLSLTDLPSRPRGTPIDVVYRYDNDRILQVDIIDVETGVGNKSTLDLTGALGDKLEAKKVDIRTMVIG